MLHLSEWIFYLVVGESMEVDIIMWVDILISIGIVLFTFAIVYSAIKYRDKVEKRERKRDDAINKLIEMHKLNE